MNGIKGPRKTRMGDIYHSIKATVDKMTKSYTHSRQAKLKEMEESVRAKESKVGWRQALKVQESEESLDDIPKDEKLLEFAEKLREAINKDPNIALDSGVMAKQLTNQFMMKKKMQPKEKVGDIVIPSSNIDQLIDMVKRHYFKKLNNEKKGNREIREIQ